MTHLRPPHARWSDEMRGCVAHAVAPMIRSLSRSCRAFVFRTHGPIEESVSFGLYLRPATDLACELADGINLSLISDMLISLDVVISVDGAAHGVVDIEGPLVGRRILRSSRLLPERLLADLSSLLGPARATVSRVAHRLPRDAPCAAEARP